jgi:hypothetical protein
MKELRKMPELKDVWFYKDLASIWEQLQNGLEVEIILTPDCYMDIYPPDGYPLPEEFKVHLTLERLKIK